MRASLRLTVTGISAVVLVGMFACSGKVDETTDEIPTEPRPATPAGGEGVKPPATDGSATPTQPPKTCELFETFPGRMPELTPAACKTCAQDKCCMQITRCYGTARVDGGTDMKTPCQLFGECEAACNANPTCEAQCETMFDEPTAEAWWAAGDCIYGPSPTGCQDFCH